MRLACAPNAREIRIYTAQIVGEDLARSHGKLSNACINIFVPGS